MGRHIKTSVLIWLVCMGLMGNAWGGWFSFEPNILVLDGAYVARELADLQDEAMLRQKGEITLADALIKESRVLVIDSKKYDNKVEFVKYTQEGDSFFVLVKDESGTKMWADMQTLVCQETDGSKRPVSQADLTKGEFMPLSN